MFNDVFGLKAKASPGLSYKNNLKRFLSEKIFRFWKIFVKMDFCAVVDLVDTQISNFAIEHLLRNGLVVYKRQRGSGLT